MDEKDKELLNLLQKGLPLARDPYGVIGKQLSIERSEVLERIVQLKERGYIRRLGGTFDTKAMGYTSLLFGAEVETHAIEAVAQYISGVKGVTHNYKRDGALNMWFTLSTATEEERADFVKNLSRLEGVKSVYPFPKLKSFKLSVFFDMKE